VSVSLFFIFFCLCYFQGMQDDCLPQGMIIVTTQSNFYTLFISISLVAFEFCLSVAGLNAKCFIISLWNFSRSLFNLSVFTLHFGFVSAFQTIDEDNLPISLEVQPSLQPPNNREMDIPQ